MSAHGLSKSRIIAYRQCPKKLWLQAHCPELLKEDTAISSRLAVGTQVGSLARSFYPDGILINADDLGQALSDTSRALEGGHKPIFEATLQAEGVLIRADLLVPDGDGYRMIEVKSSTGVKEYHIEDAAVQTWVARKAGLHVSTTEIAHINNAFIYQGQGQYEGIFAIVDISNEILKFQGQIPAWITGARETLAGQEPKVEPSDQCWDPFDCPFYDYCSPTPEFTDVEYPPEILPYGGSLAAKLREEGFTDLRQVPVGRLTNPRHLRVWRATMSGRPELAHEAGEVLRALFYPRNYLDFETIQFAIPIWAGTRPYQQIPFQWSCHEESVSGALTHYAWLAKGEGDPRREFAVSMLDRVGLIGPILVYNAAFERSRMLELAEFFPDLGPALHAAADRIVDLLPITREHYYHPDMRGSWSIKAVLPTIAPELAYDGLDVSDGGMAQEAFMTLLDPTMETGRRETMRQALLDYCERDTLAMVRVAHFLQNDKMRKQPSI